MGEVILQLLGNQLQRLKNEYPSLLGMLCASAFLAKWLDPHMLKYLDKAWTLIEKKEYIKSAPEIIYIISLVGAAWGTLGCYSFLVLLLFEKISGNDDFVAIQTSLNRWSQGYFLAVIGYLIFAFLELDEYLIRCINLVKNHHIILFFPLFGCGLLGLAIFNQLIPLNNFLPQEKNKNWRSLVVIIIYFMLLYLLMEFYLNIPGLDVLGKQIQ